MLVDREKVNKGVQLLDEKIPDWYNIIDLEKLDIASYEHCILGQIAGGNFVDGLHMLGLHDVSIPMSEHGFNATLEAYLADSVRSYGELEGMWREIINERRDNAESGS